MWRWGWMVLCRCPVIGWRPVQGIPRLSPKITWERLQLTYNANDDKQYRKCAHIWDGRIGRQLCVFSSEWSKRTRTWNSTPSVFVCKAFKTQVSFPVCRLSAGDKAVFSSKLNQSILTHDYSPRHIPGLSFCQAVTCMPFLFLASQVADKYNLVLDFIPKLCLWNWRKIKLFFLLPLFLFIGHLLYRKRKAFPYIVNAVRSAVFTPANKRTNETDEACFHQLSVKQVSASGALRDPYVIGPGHDNYTDGQQRTAVSA